MSTSGWSQDLAIGIDAVDAEHMRLLSLVERAEAARAEGAMGSAVRLLRLFLGEFERHFEQEQGLLSGLGSAALAQRRSEYRTSQAVVTAHPLDADDLELVEHVAAHARAWLMDHILRQDMPNRRAYPGGAATPRRPLWRRFDVVKLRWRIALLAAVPLAALVFLTYTVVGDLRQRAESMDLLRQMNKMNGEVGRLVHELQRERGLATLYIADRSKGPERMQAQITATDLAHGRFDLAAAALSGKLKDGPAKQVLDNAIVALDIIPEIRSDVMSGGFDGVETIDIYSTAIEDLNAVVPEVVRTLLPSDFASNTLAYLFLLEAKERAGQLRAAGVAMLGHEARGGRPHKTLQELAAEEQAYSDGFLELAPAEIARAFQAARDAGGAEYDGLLTRLEAGETADTTPQEWFDVASRRFDAMNEVQSELIARLTIEAATLQHDANRRAVWLGGALGALLVLCAAMVVFLGWTILPPLRRIGDVIQRLARGERAVELPGLEAGDELGEIARSVQVLKERLVHGDLLAASRWTENAERLRSVTDNVPGVVFRILQPAVGHPAVACVSRKLREVTGLAAADAVDKPVRTLLRRLLRPEDWPVVLLALHRAGAQPLDFEFRMRDGAPGQAMPGRPRWLRVLASPTRVDGGWVWDGVALDVSGLKRAEEEQARTSAELARVYRSRATAQLTRGIGQELAQLVQPLLAHAERAAGSLAFTDPARADLLAVLAAAGRIRSLGERVADMAEGSDGERVPVDAVAMVAERLESLRSLLPCLAVTARLEGAGARVLAARADMDRLLNHLFAYASAEGGLTGVVTELAEGGAALRLAVGCGGAAGGGGSGARPPGRFPVSRQERGSGLALAMARAMADSCGGRLDVLVAGDGLEVEVVLPLHQETRDNVVVLQGVSTWQKSRP